MTHSDADSDLISPVDRLYAEVTQMCLEYCEAYGCKPSALGRAALNDTIFIQKILAGTSVTTNKIRKLEAFLRNPVSPSEALARTAAERASLAEAS